MAITNLDQIISKLPGQKIDSTKLAFTPRGAGSYHSLWQAIGLPGSGAVPGSANGIIPTSSTLGTLKLTNSTGANLLYLARLVSTGTTVHSLVLYDRLWTNSGLNGTLTTAQTWTPPSLTRSTNGDSVEAWLEVYTALGSTAVDATLTYTNSLGVSSRSAIAKLPTTPVAGQIIQFSLQAGDLGIQTASQVTLSATTGTAGNFGITFARRIATVPAPVANGGTMLDIFGLGMPTIENNSALAFLILASGGTSVTSMLFDLNIIEG